MAQKNTMKRVEPRSDSKSGSRNGSMPRHEHRTAKVVELVSTSKRGFKEAVANGLKDASESMRGITGAHVENMSVTCDDGKILEYKVNLKIAFGVERT